MENLGKQRPFVLKPEEEQRPQIEDRTFKISSPNLSCVETVLLEKKLL